MASSLAEGIAMANKVFQANFDKTNVVALWTEERLMEFTDNELDDLESIARQELRFYDDYQGLCKRLLKRIKNVRSEKEEESKRDEH